MYLFKRLSVFSPFDRSMVDEPTPEITNKLLLALNDDTLFADFSRVAIFLFFQTCLTTRVNGLWDR